MKKKTKIEDTLLEDIRLINEDYKKAIDNLPADEFFPKENLAEKAKGTFLDELFDAFKDYDIAKVHKEAQGQGDPFTSKQEVIEAVLELQGAGILDEKYKRKIHFSEKYQIRTFEKLSNAEEAIIPEKSQSTELYEKIEEAIFFSEYKNLKKIFNDPKNKQYLPSLSGIDELASDPLRFMKKSDVTVENYNAKIYEIDRVLLENGADINKLKNRNYNVEQKQELNRLDIHYKIFSKIETLDIASSSKNEMVKNSIKEFIKDSVQNNNTETLSILMNDKKFSIYRPSIAELNTLAEYVKSYDKDNNGSFKTAEILVSHGANADKFKSHNFSKEEKEGLGKLEKEYQKNFKEQKQEITKEVYNLVEQFRDVIKHDKTLSKKEAFKCMDRLEKEFRDRNNLDPKAIKQLRNLAVELEFIQEKNPKKSIINELFNGLKKIFGIEKDPLHKLQDKALNNLSKETKNVAKDLIKDILKEPNQEALDHKNTKKNNVQTPANNKSIER